MNQRNPFEPEPSGPPLQLSFDSRSLADLEGDERTDAEYLISLSLTPHIDGLVIWSRSGFAEALPAAEVSEIPSRPDDLSVNVRGESGFIGGIRNASQFERMADNHKMAGAEREWFIHYGQATTFHTRAERHLFVTADKRLLEARQKGPFAALWRRNRIFSVHQALAAVGVLFGVYDTIFDDVESRYSHRINSYTLWWVLANTEMPSRIRFFDAAIRKEDQALARTNTLHELQGSLHDRAMDLWRARDYVRRENFRLRHNNATVDAVHYHQRAAVACLAAACDSFAQLALVALRVPSDSWPTRQRIGLGRTEFRGLLRDQGAEGLARAAGRAAPLLIVLKRFRDPLIHDIGLRGMPLEHTGSPGRTEITAPISELQAKALKGLGRDKAQAWGLREFAGDPHLDPCAFVDRLAIEGVGLLDELFGALGDDLGAGPQSEEPDVQYSLDDVKLRRLRLLTGLVPTGARRPRRR